MNFKPSPEVFDIFTDLLDSFERRITQKDNSRHNALRFKIEKHTLPNYFNQTDPAPRQIANEQLQKLESAGWVTLKWVKGEHDHILESVTLTTDQVDAAFRWLRRVPIAARRARLSDHLLGERFRFKGWRLMAIQFTLDQLREEKSPAPFSLDDDDLNRDLLTALTSLDEVTQETPHRVFSVRVFNDSKRFEPLMGAVATLARRHNDEWRGLNNDEVLRELNLVANPNHIYLHGAWKIIDNADREIALEAFHPSVGVAAAQAEKARQVRLAALQTASPLICVENQTSFYELIRHTPQVTAICLWGNPSPACRHLLRRVEDVALCVWADIDYGGLNILAQLREQVNESALPYLMDMKTFEAHAKWAKPLTDADSKNLTRLLRRPSLFDMQPLITHLLARKLKLEQEAIVLPFTI
ncbi:MAG: DUF2399 domain-containing protein [Chloroflexi bacterium]|nr:DUF2399 domain-containing protein [Chloroflexota bacterium]